MSWNKPSDNKKLMVQRKSGHRYVRFFICVMCLALGAVGVWWLWPDSEELRDTVSMKPTRIKEMKPARMSNAVVCEKVVEEKKRQKTDAERLKEIRDRYGNNIPEQLKTVVYFLEHPVKQSFNETKPDYAIFKHGSENDIASLLVVEPGNYFLRKPFYDENFDRDFKASLSAEIEFSEDDTIHQRELKQAVKDTKKEIVERMRAGEKPSDILNAAVDQMYELGVYKSQLEKSLNEFYSNEKFTDRDIEDFVTAANEMLEKQGASKLQMPTLTMRQAKLRFIARKKEQQDVGGRDL